MAHQHLFNRRLSQESYMFSSHLVSFNCRMPYSYFNLVLHVKIITNSLHATSRRCTNGHNLVTAVQSSLWTMIYFFNFNFKIVSDQFRIVSPWSEVLKFKLFQL